jgi:hypothetical protein
MLKKGLLLITMGLGHIILSNDSIRSSHNSTFCDHKTVFAQILQSFFDFSRFLIYTFYHIFVSFYCKNKCGLVGDIYKLQKLNNFSSCGLTEITCCQIFLYYSLRSQYFQNTSFVVY